jgi:A/G-specific adenine glycosylase
VLEGDELRRFQAALLAWYGPRARPLRIRTTRDPWAILVSEVMAQQTQISRVDEAWVLFMERYPTPGALAEAPTADVLRAWAGLGYNRRALNLQRAAVAIEAEHEGRVPASIEQLEALPGVGPYTARAVAAIAFGQPLAAVDTNVRRVVERLLGRSLAPRQLQAQADTLVETGDPATWTHASMELGATVCVSRVPRCPSCPVADWCASAGRVSAPPRRAGTAGPAFELTTRWLRGRIVERLRALEADAWTQLPASIGTHGPADVEAAVGALQREGMLERRPDGAVRLPSG